MSSARLLDALRRLRATRILVYGDLLLDEYVFGRADRLSPEKPVPVVTYEHRDLYLGGAGNVVRNLAALGCDAVLVAVVGDDDAGRACRNLVRAAGLDDRGLVDHRGWITPRKLRIHAGQHALLRVDHERGDDGVGAGQTGDLHERLVRRLLALADGREAAIVSDYRKGTVFADGVAAVARGLEGRPVIVDPKGSDPDRYRGATFLLPNEREMAELVGAGWDDEGARRLAGELGLRGLILTRSERGVRVYRGEEVVDLPARAREVFDVTGAGDTFAAMFTACLAAGEDELVSAGLANVAAGIVVARVGTATPSTAEIESELRREALPGEKIVDVAGAVEFARDLRARGRTVVFTNGCFDLLHAGHIKYLEASRALGDGLIVALNSDASVRRLKGPDRPILDERERGEILSALSCVDRVVVFDQDTPIALIEAIRPQVLAKGADYAMDEIVGADLVLDYGGRVERVELVPGKSTSGIVERIRSADGEDAARDR